MQIDPDILFTLGSRLALIGWAVLIFLPRRIALLLAIPKFAIPVLLGLAYSGIMAARFFDSGGGYNSIEEVRALFAHDEILVAGWLHYLAFDLFVGVWIAERSDAIGLPRLIQTVILAATFLFGPLGLVLFLLTRAGMSGLVARRAQA